MVYSNNFNQVRVGVRNGVVTQVVNAVDADATAFIAAAGITDLTQAAAISTLVDDLKAYGIWSKMKALYPFVGGSAASHKFNLKDPRDIPDAYQLVFNGGWIHSNAGALSNGVSGFANTNLIPSTRLSVNNTHTSIYVNNTLVAYTSHPSFGCMDVSTNTKTFYTNLSLSNTYYSFIGDEKGSSTYGVSYSNSDNKGFYIASRTSSTSLKGYKNDLLKATTTLQNTGTLPPSSYFYGGVNNGTAGLLALTYNNYSHAFASIGDGLSDGEAANFYTAVQKFQTTLGRQVGTPAVSDSDAQAFLNAASITDTTQSSAINTLVTDLKAAGIWTKMKAVYPFIGGNATSHKFNLKDPRDLNDAYRLTFTGGWTHTSTGATPNGSNGYADTNLNTSVLSITNTSYSIYLRTVTNSAYTWAMDLGVFTADYNGRYGLGYISQDGNSYFDVYNRTSISNSNLNKGYIQYTRTSSNLSKVFYKNNLINTNTNINSQYSNPNNTIYLGALHLGSGLDSYSNREQSFVTIGDGLNDTESTALYNAVQKYQTTLGRQVDVPLVSDSDAQAFLTAAGITSYTQANAVNTLVVDLKSAGVWTKMKALYPFVGGTATSHKWNLKDPRDLDVAYRLTFNGGMSHDSRGIVPNGTTGYANTFIDPYVLSINSGFGYYSQTNNTINSTDIGAISYNMSNPPTYSPVRLFQISNSGTTKSVSISSDVSISYSDTDTRGFYQGWRSDSSTIKSMKDSTILSTSAPYLSSTAYSNGMRYYIGGRYESGIMQTPSSRVLSFSYFQENFNDTDAQNLYTAVQKFQTSLGRQVGTPVYNTNGLVLNLDAGNANSYPGTGTTWFDLASGNNGTLVNGPTYNSSNGGSLVFDGVNDYVDCGLSNIDLPTNITLSAWINQSTLSGYKNIITKEDSTGTGMDYGLTTSPNGNLYFWFHNGSYKIHETSTGVINNTNQWYNVVSVFDDVNNRVKMYVNGIEIYNQPETTSLLVHTNSKLFIGWRNSFLNGQSFYGNISLTNVYNRALSATEVLQNFNNTRGRFGL